MFEKMRKGFPRPRPRETEQPKKKPVEKDATKPG